MQVFVPVRETAKLPHESGNFAVTPYLDRRGAARSANCGLGYLSSQTSSMRLPLKMLLTMMVSPLT